MKHARLTVRLFGIGEARADGIAAGIMLTALTLLACSLWLTRARETLAKRRA